MRAQRSIASYVSALASGGLTIVFALFATPLRLRWLGEETMGLYRTLLDTLAYLPLLEFGIATALSSLFATALARDDSTHVRRLLRLGLRELAKVSALKLVVGLGLSLALLHYLDIPSGLRRDFVIACGVGVLSTVITPVNAFRALLDAAQRGYSIHLVLTLQAALSTLLALWFAQLGWGVTGQLAALAGGTVLSSALLVAASVRRFGALFGQTPDAEGAEAAAKASLRELNWPAFVIQLGGVIGLLSDSILVALFISPRVVMRFFLTQRLASVAQMQLQNIGTSSWAAMAEIYARGETALFNGRVIELTRLVAIASMTILIPVAAFNRTFIALWVGTDLHGGTAVTLAAALVAFGQAIVSLWGWVFHAAGRLPLVAPVSTATVAVNLVASIIFVRNYGIVGPLLGTLLSFALVSSWAFPLLMRRTFDVSITRLASALAWPLMLGLPVMGVSGWVSTQPFFHTWEGWLVGTSTTAVTYLVMAWVFLLDAQDRLTWRSRVRAALEGLRRPH